MKWWYWLILELLIIFGVIAWVYFFPSEIEDDFAKGMIGFVLIYAIEEYKETNRRKSMDYKEDMTCGECLKYVFCPVANHNANHKACMKITTNENYTIEQNAGENQIEGGVVSISGSVEKKYRPFKDCDELVECWEKKIFIPAMRYTKQKVLFRPEIWVKSKEYGTDNLITAFDGDNESIGGSCVFIQDIWVDMKELFDNFTFLDGSPCGLDE